MLDGERVVALLPARGGSTGVPRKNIREVGDRPLLAWSIDVANETGAVDRTVVSTDDDEIAGIAREYGAEVINRPLGLATDDALVADAVRHAVAHLREAGESAAYAVLLEPTCPFRAPGDVQDALERLADEKLDSVATFTEAALNPHRAWTVEDGRPTPVVDGADPWQPRQALPEAYELNGGAYAFAIDALPDEGPAMLFGETGAVTMPPERSVDVDTPLDLAFARLIAERQGDEHSLDF